jgi:hypothetical protein
VTSSQNPSAAGQSVTFTATVTGPSGDTTVPTGNVSFLDGTTTLGSGALNGSGQATFNTSSLSTASHSITAVYSGDSNFAGSTSAVLTQTVGTPSFSVSFNPTTVTVKAGQSATTVVSIQPSLGFNQQVSFACSGLPTASTCAFSPVTVTPSSATAETTTLTVATDVSTTAQGQSAPLNHRERSDGVQVFFAMLILGMSGFVRMRRRGNGWLLTGILMVGIGLVLTGCGGSGSHGGGGGTKTPTGTSTVTVTATSGNLSQTATFTLTVQ